MINRTDTNQKAIIDCFKQLGYSVLSLSNVKSGCPDLLCAKNGINILVEIKTEKGKLNPLQKEFIQKWNSRVFVIRDIDGVIELDNLI